MSDAGIAVLRWVLLAGAALNLLQATVLFRPSRRRLLEPWLASMQRAGGAVPPLLRNERVLRALAVVAAAVLVGCWWYLGTPAGAARLRDAS
jgi:hypothetical protein